MSEINLRELEKLAGQAIEELLAAADLKPGQVVVIGCSTSEVRGERIGSASTAEIAEAIMNGVLPPLQEKQLCLAVQCCEHLNRALVVESQCAEKYGWEAVTVVPHLKAGGAFATEAFRRFSDAVVVEKIAAHAGMDIGDTFIGMHLKNIPVPVRGSLKEIGMAHVTMAKTRPRLIGGERSVYKKYL